MDFQTELAWLGISFVYVALAIAAVFLSKLLKDFLTPYRLDEELTQKDNPALGLTMVGYFTGVIIIFLGATVGPSPEELPSMADLAQELGLDLAYALGGMILLNVSCVIVDKLVLYKFSTRKEIIDDRNAGTGAVEAGSLIASGLVIAGAIHGEGDLITAVAFYGLGQVVLVLFGLFYQWTVSYDVHKEIEEDNVPAGVSLGMSMVAIGILMHKATFGDFISWEQNLMMFGLYAIAGFITLLVIRKIVDLFMLRGTTLHQEIVDDRNLNAAMLEGSLSISAASAILLIF